MSKAMSKAMNKSMRKVSVQEHIQGQRALPGRRESIEEQKHEQNTPGSNSDPNSDVLPSPLPPASAVPPSSPLPVLPGKPHPARLLQLSSELSIPIEAVTETFAILAKRGVGKTHTASVLAEEMVSAGLHVVILDPLDVWWGIRSSADGEHEGLPVLVLGGSHGDLPLDATNGSVLADLVVEEEISVVLSLRHMTKGDQRRFVADFCERLYHRKGESEHRQPLHIILDEADSYVPQKVFSGQERMVGAIDDLVRRGRSSGVGITLISQRAAVINKDVLSQIEMLVVMRTTNPLDRKAMEAWIEAHDIHGQKGEFMASLASMPIGTAWFWSPGWLDLFKKVRVRPRETFDSSATPKVGERPLVPKRLADVDLDRVRQLLASTIEKSKDTDPKELRKRIAELEKQLGEGPPTGPAEVRVEQVVERVREIERVEVPVVPQSVIEAVGRLRAIELELVEVQNELRVIRLDFQTAADANAADVDAKTGADGAALPSDRKEGKDSHTLPTQQPQSQQLQQRQKVPGSPARSSSPPVAVTVEEVPLRKGERAILEALVRHYPMKVTRAQLGTLSKYAHSGGTFGNYFGTLKRAKLIEEGGGLVGLVPQQVRALGYNLPSTQMSGEQLLEVWRGALPGGARKMLDVLVEAYPGYLSRTELGTRSGYEASGGTFGNYLGILRRNGLVEVQGSELRAVSALFGTGGPETMQQGRVMSGQ